MSDKGSEAEIVERLCALAAEQVGVDPSVVRPESDFFTDLNFDSLDAVEFVMRIEDEFDLSIDDQQAEGVRTARQAWAMLSPVLGSGETAGEGRGP